MNRLMLLGFLLATATAHASGTLQLGEPIVEDERITVPVLLGGDLSGGVSAMDFRFKYNPEALQPVSVVAGSAAEGAGKRVMSNLQTPGEYAVVMMGFNQAACGPGEAIKIVLQRLHGQDEKWDLSLSDATMSAADGRAIESRVLPAVIEPEPPEETPVRDDAARQGPVADRRPAESHEEAPEPGMQVVRYGGPVEVAAGSGPMGPSNEERLRVAMKSAGEARSRIDTPVQTSEAGDAGDGSETGRDQADTTGLAAAATGEPRVNMASVAVPGTAGAQGLEEITVEPQPDATTGQRPPELAVNVGRRVFYGVSALVVVAVAAASWRRSRLIR